jgi:hypothetical protein
MGYSSYYNWILGQCDTISFNFETKNLATQFYHVSRQHVPKVAAARTVSNIAASAFVSPLFIFRHAALIIHSLNIFADKKVVLILVETIIGSVFIAAGGLFCFHTYLCTQALTTLEFFESLDKKRQCDEQGVRYVSEYSSGNTINNLRQVLGYQESIIKTILIPSIRPSPPIVSSKYHNSDSNNNSSSYNSSYNNNSNNSCSSGSESNAIERGPSHRLYEIV